MTYTENSPVACNVQPPVEEEPAFDMEQVQRDNARLNQAILFATERHAGQLRKGTTLPYILHPLETLQILTEMQADIDLQIAGVLHDTIEDTETTAEELAMLFGDDVAALVNHHSEDKSKSWAERKTTAIIAAKQADERIKMLILADKLSNLRAIARDYAAIGDALWERFNAPKEKQAWYYNGILDALSDLQQYTETASAYRELTEHYKDAFVIYRITPDYEKLYQANTFGEAYCLTKGNPQWMPVNYRFRNNDIPLTRKEAEILEDKWYDIFLNAVENDLQDKSYPLFQNAGKTFGITLEAYQLTFQGQSTITLNEDDTYTFISQLRMMHGIHAPLAQILFQTFGSENSEAIFRMMCGQMGISA